jgi:hypothetical protein
MSSIFRLKPAGLFIFCSRNLLLSNSSGWLSCFQTWYFVFLCNYSGSKNHAHRLPTLGFYNLSLTCITYCLANIAQSLLKRKSVAVYATDNGGRIKIQRECRFSGMAGFFTLWVIINFRSLLPCYRLSNL